MKQSRLSGIVETEEEELGMLVHKTKRGEDIVDCSARRASVSAEAVSGFVI